MEVLPSQGLPYRAAQTPRVQIQAQDLSFPPKQNSPPEIVSLAVYVFVFLPTPKNVAA